MIIRTPIDDVLDIIEEFRVIDIKKLNKLTGLASQNLELYLKCFEKSGLVKLSFPLSGNIVVKATKNDN